MLVRRRGCLNILNFVTELVATGIVLEMIGMSLELIDFFIDIPVGDIRLLWNIDLFPCLCAAHLLNSIIIL
jgi:hypothetical protein